MPRRLRRSSVSKCMPATGSIMRARETIAALPEIVELNIGHFLIGEAIFVGLDDAIRAMRGAMDRGRRADGEARMILGLGSDLVDIRRIEKVLARHGDRFIERIFTADRDRQGRAARDPDRHLRQALRRQGSLLQGARHRISQAACSGATWGWSICRPGRPTMALTGGALARLEAITPAGPRGPNRPQPDRRISARPSYRDHPGGAFELALTGRKNVISYVNSMA